MSDFDERTQSLVDEFAKQYGEQPTWIAIGPGRVNLIGEHTDYNDGFVMPVALQRDVRMAVRAREDRLVRIYSSEYDDWGEFDLDAIAYQQDKLWINYVQGVASMLEEAGLELTGIDAVLSGNVPRASGLSSSAALEVASIKGLMAAADVQDALSGTQIAKIAQRAENQFVGVNCGIMDQFISVLGVEGHALLIDCRSLDYELVPFPANASSGDRQHQGAPLSGLQRLQRAPPAVRRRRGRTSAGAAGDHRPARCHQRAVGGQQGSALRDRLSALPPCGQRKRTRHADSRSAEAGRSASSGPTHVCQPCQPAR